jgi:hypothetical protein
VAPATFLEPLAGTAEAEIVPSEFGAALPELARLLEEAVDASDRCGDQRGSLLAHVSPLGWEYITLTGEYHWPA